MGRMGRVVTADTGMQEGGSSMMENKRDYFKNQVHVWNLRHPFWNRKL